MSKSMRLWSSSGATSQRHVTLKSRNIKSIYTNDDTYLGVRERRGQDYENAGVNIRWLRGTLASTRPLRVFSTKYRRPFFLPKSIRRVQTGRVTGMLNLSVVVSVIIIENGNRPLSPQKQLAKVPREKRKNKSRFPRGRR